MRAVLFGTWNRGHSASRIVATAVREAGFDIVEIHEPLWEKTRDKNASYWHPKSLARLAAEWLRAAWRLAAAWRRSGGAPVAVVGFNGQLDVLLLRLLAGRYGPRIVFAPLVSLTETLVEDRAVFAEGSLAARVLRAIDRLTCRAADVVVVDTEAHRRWFAETLGVDTSKLLVCHLGADPDAFLQPPAATQPPALPDRRLEVLYFGQYLPLHGLDVIVDAVGRLAMRGENASRLRFTFIGTGELRARIERELRATRAEVRFIDWVAYEELAARIAKADIVLGIFGSSKKARMVVPNKVYEAAAVGRAIVTADTPALREVFEDGRELVLCGADGRSLADAIERLADPDTGEALRARLGSAARRRMEEAFSPQALGRCWSVALRGARAFETLRTARAGAADAAPAPAKVGVSILSFQDARRTLACLHSLAGDGYPNLDVLVVDNGSVDRERRELEQGLRLLADTMRPELLALDRNTGFAGGHNIAMERLFARGADYVLLLNSDTIVAPGSVSALVRGAAELPNAGPVGPRVSDSRPGGAPLSLGERYTASLLWAPRSLLRVRSLRQRPYPVGGVIGCAMLVPRALWEKVGGFDERLFAYYEEVDLCLRAREAGFRPVVVPEADVGHAGARGFASGMTPLAAWLKARNLAIVGERRVRGVGHLVFGLGYLGLVAASAAVYALRGRFRVASALLAGQRAAARDEHGEPPAWLFAASGYASSGLSSDRAASTDGSTSRPDEAASGARHEEGAAQGTAAHRDASVGPR